MDEELKKKRLANFNSSDRSLLLKVVNAYKSIIESKKTDATTWREKMETWKKIEVKFNSCTTGAPRTDKQLKNKYESVKKDLKKRHTQHMSYLRGTGGGPYVPPAPYNEEEKELAETIALSIQGLSNNYDSDGLAGTSGITLKENDTSNIDDIVIDHVEVDWTEPHAKLLQTEVHPALGVNTQSWSSAKFDVDCHIDITNREIEPTDEDNLTNDHRYHKLVDEEISKSSSVISEMKDKPIFTTSNKENETPKKKNQPEPWQSRRRPIINPSKRCNASASAKFEIVAQKKCELIMIEQEIAIEKKEQNRKEHELRMRLSRLQEEEQVMKNELLRYNLDKIMTAKHSSLYNCVSLFSTNVRRFCIIQ